MNFKEHSDIVGMHAFLGASRYHWINYDEFKLASSYKSWLATQRGIRLHTFASDCIRLKIELPKMKQTLNCYVNDGIKFRMKTEQPLQYSRNCFGTADTISFDQNFLRIHDYKSGVSPTSMHQLEVYSALFCLEYNFSPATINIELRIYQSNEILVHRPPIEEILFIMDKIIMFDKFIDEIKTGE